MFKIILLFAALAKPELGMGVAVGKTEYADIETCRAAVETMTVKFKAAMELQAGTPITARGECHTAEEIDALIKQLEAAKLVPPEPDPFDGKKL